MMSEKEMDIRCTVLRKYFVEARNGYMTKGGEKRSMSPWEHVPSEVDARRTEQERRVQRAIKMAKMMKSPTGDH